MPSPISTTCRRSSTTSPPRGPTGCRRCAVDQLGEPAARRLLTRIGDDVPESYRSGVLAADAVGDMVRLLELVDSGDVTRTALIRHVDDIEGDWRMRVYRRGDPIALAELLPMLGHVGLRALEERPYGLEIDGQSCYVYDIGVRVPPGVVIDDRRHANVRATFEGLLAGDIEPDGFNRLVLIAGLTAAQANVLRCYAKYTSQIGFTFSQRYIEETLARLPHLASLLVELFEARFDPALERRRPDRRVRDGRRRGARRARRRAVARRGPHRAHVPRR